MEETRTVNAADIELIHANVSKMMAETMKLGAETSKVSAKTVCRRDMMAAVFQIGRMDHA